MIPLKTRLVGTPSALKVYSLVSTQQCGSAQFVDFEIGLDVCVQKIPVKDSSKQSRIEKMILQNNGGETSKNPGH